MERRRDNDTDRNRFGTFFDYERDTDPGKVGPGKTWLDTTDENNLVTKRRNEADTDWVFFSSDSGSSEFEQLPDGATSADIQAALDDTDITEVRLPSGTTTITLVPRIVHSNTRLRGHPDGTSKLLQLDDIDDGLGTSHTIMIGAYNGSAISNVEIDGFAIEHDRVTSPDMRSLAIDLWYHCHDLKIHDIDGINLTSDFFTGRPYPWTTLGCDGLEFDDITVNGIWEGLFNWHAGHLKNCRGARVQMTASNAHAGYQGPMLAELNIEQEVGSVENLEFSDWSVTLTGTAAGPGNSGSHGIVMNANIPKGACWYTDCRFNRFVIDGAYFGVYLPMVNYSEGPLPALKTVNIFNEIAVSNSVKPLYVWPDSGEAPSLQVVSNTCKRGSAAGYNHWNTSFAADQEVIAVDVDVITGVELFVRSQTKNAYDDCYFLNFQNATTARIFKRAGGVQTLLGATIPVTHVDGTDDWKLRAVGAGPVTVTIYKNDVEVDNRVDSDPDAIIGAGYVGVGISGATSSINEIRGGEVATTASLDAFNRADEDPLDPTNWTSSGGWRTGSANDRLIFSGCTGDAGSEEIDQTRLGVNGPIAIVDGLENDWVV